MRHSGLWFLGSFLALSTLCNDITHAKVPSYQWERQDYQAAQCSVLMPAQPTFRQADYPYVFGNITENIWSWKSPGLELDLEYAELPGLAVFFAGYKKIFRDGKKALLEEIGGVETAFEYIRFGNYFGAEFEFSVPANDEREAQIGKARFYLVQRRLYVLVATTPADQYDIASIDHYLNSLELLQK